MNIERLPITITADPSRVVLRYLDLKDPEHFEGLLKRFIQLDRASLESLWEEVSFRFASRHRDYERHLLKMARRLEAQAGWELHFDEEKRLLLGAFVTKEFALEASGIFNPSIIPHPDQSGLPPGVLRFVLTLRAVGEGHYSTLTFREGVMDAAGEILLESAPSNRTPAQRDSRLLSHEFLRSRLFYWQNFDPGVIKLLPDPFSFEDATALDDSPFREVVLQIIDNNYSLAFAKNIPITERVILPMAASESRGMEDVRMVKTDIQNIPAYLGTYTAYDGRHTRTKLLATDDFREFKIRSFYGGEVKDKGMALFPRKIKGRYAMVSTSADRTLSIMYSDDILFWEECYDLPDLGLGWGLLALVNCGAPIETEDGWLLLFSGVGPMFQHNLGIALLDREQPEKLLAFLPDPLLALQNQERVGYEPNRLFSCGWMAHSGKIYIPYSMSDFACGFVRVDQNELVESLLASAVIHKH